MAEFKRSYEVDEEMKGDYKMDDGVGLGAGFLGGVILGGLGGYALSTNNRNRNDWGGGYMPYPAAVAGTIAAEGCYSIADVSNLVATKDAQYAQLNATQSSEFNVLTAIQTSNTGLAKGLCDVTYELAQQNNTTQKEVIAASAKADLCCCRTQGMIEKIVPEIQNFYLQDQLTQCRLKDITGAQDEKINIILNNVNALGSVVSTLASQGNKTIS